MRACLTLSAASLGPLRDHPVKAVPPFVLGGPFFRALSSSYLPGKHGNATVLFLASRISRGLSTAPLFLLFFVFVSLYYRVALSDPALLPSKWNLRCDRS